MSNQAYPVVVTYTTRHLVWVHADNPAEAAARVDSYPHDFTNSENFMDGGWRAQQPKTPWDWQEVYDHDGAPHQESHVDSHNAEVHRHKREAAKAACVAAGHPDTDSPLGDGRQFCKVCHEYLPVAEAMAR